MVLLAAGKNWELLLSHKLNTQRIASSNNASKTYYTQTTRQTLLTLANTNVYRTQKLLCCFNLSYAASIWSIKKITGKIVHWLSFNAKHSLSWENYCVCECCISGCPAVWRSCNNAVGHSTRMHLVPFAFPFGQWHTSIATAFFLFCGVLLPLFNALLSLGVLT